MEDFYKDPLLQWLRTFPDAKKDLSFDDLVSGPFLHTVIHTFDESIPNNYSAPAPSDFKAKVRNLETVIKNLKCYYQTVLGQTLLESLPNALTLCDRGVPPPASTTTPQDARLQCQSQMHQLLLLVLGAAVQCSQKEHIISSMKTLPVEVQKVFVEKIPAVTENPEKIWPSELDDPSCLREDIRDGMYRLLVRKVKGLVEQRDAAQRGLMEAEMAAREETAAALRRGSKGDLSPEKSHLAVEASEFKAKIRKLNQQLEEKTECLAETGEELEKLSTLNTKLRQEALDLAQDARSAKTYRDELDIVRERANKVDKLESEIHRYKDKVNDIDFYKSRVEELREDNKILVETKEILEEQLDSSRKRSEHLLTLENEILRYKSDLSSVQIEKEGMKERMSELEEENLALQMSSRSSMSQSRSLMDEVQNLKADGDGSGKNMYNEKLEKDTTRVHRLELENQRLRSELDSAREKGFHESSERILDLEKEKQKLSVNVKQLELLRAKDEAFATQLERSVSEERTRAQKAEQMSEALKEAHERLNLEKETEVVQLTKQMDNIRKRQTQTQNEQISSLEEENKKLTKSTAKLETEAMKMKHTNKRLSDRNEELGKVVEQFEDLKMEKEKSNSLLEELQKQNEELKVLKEEDENRSESLSSLKADHNRQTKQLERLKADVNALTMEKQQLNSKLQKVTRKSEKLQTDNMSLSSLETERDELRDTINKMRLEIDQLTVSSKASEEQDQKHTQISSENNKLNRQLATTQRKLEEQREENSQLETQAQSLQKTIDTLKTTARRVEQLEKENFELEDCQHKLDREVKSLRKEMERHKHSSEANEAQLEELLSKLKVVEKEKLRLDKESKSFVEEVSKMAELEAEHRKLLQDYSMEKRALVKLRQELVDEKVKRGQAETELQTAKDNMQRFGVHESAMIDESFNDERMKTLEGSVSKLLDEKQKRVSLLEGSLKELRDKCSTLQQKNAMLQIHVDAGDSKTKLEAELTKVMRERDQFQADAVNLKMDSKSAKEKASLFENKIRKLHEEAANIQVENSTLQSQSSSLLSQINQLQISQVNLETFKRKAEESEKQWQIERADLLRDQAGLQKLHDNLQQDYELLRAEKETLKETEKKLRTDLRKFHAMSLSLNEGQDELIRAKEAIDLERENLRADARTLANLRDEHARLKDDFRSLFTSNERVKSEYCSLQTDYKGLKSSSNQTKLAVTELKGQLHEAKDQLQMVDVDHTKTVNRCEVLAQMNSSLEDDRKSLMTQVSMLLTQYHDLLTQTLDDKEHFHEEERVYTDKMNNLYRQKEKLEEKIMEQYRRMENSPPKKVGLGGKIVRTMRKASSSLMTTNRPPPGATAAAAAAAPPRSRSSNSFPVSSEALTLAEQRREGAGGARHAHDADDSSSLESGCNDSLDSGQDSPLRARLDETGSTSSALRRPFGHHLSSHPQHGSDDNSADNDSVVSLSRPSRAYGGVEDRLSLGHSEVGLPLTGSSKVESSRSITKVYVNGGGGDKEGRSTSSSAATWEEDRIPPVVPARKISTLGAPERPPKPSSSSSGPRGSDDNRYRSDDDRSAEEGDVGSNKAASNEDEDRSRENTEWYEYGCV